MENSLFSLWQAYHHAPYHFPVDQSLWEASMFQDTDGDGRTLFRQSEICQTAHGFVQYGVTAFGFDENGEITNDIHRPVIRMLHFSGDFPAEGQYLLDTAMNALGAEQRIYAFFHYFGMTCCARHGKLHEQESHIHELLLKNNFVVEHENVYYSAQLPEPATINPSIQLCWKPLSPGGCREFAALWEGQEIGWGQVHFLPQENIAYLRWIYIDERWQHQGFGTAIMKCLFSALYAMEIRRFDTDTALNNLAAQGYYEKTGFTNCGITRSYFTK